MRGKVTNNYFNIGQVGITPAHAGKRRLEEKLEREQGDHPRPCGEKGSEPEKLGKGQGSPPPMRGKVFFFEKDEFHLGITPAHAGKRTLFFHYWHIREDHPRPCGEKRFQMRPVAPCWGSPPAHAGKRLPNAHMQHAAKDHPRPCGEKAPVRPSARPMLGSPPPMRGKVFLS